jgi:hypothetical protein
LSAEAEGGYTGEQLSKEKPDVVHQDNVLGKGHLTFPASHTHLMIDLLCLKKRKKVMR